MTLAAFTLAVVAGCSGTPEHPAVPTQPSRTPLPAPSAGKDGWTDAANDLVSVQCIPGKASWSIAGEIRNPDSKPVMYQLVATVPAKDKSPQGEYRWNSTLKAETSQTLKPVSFGQGAALDEKCSVVLLKKSSPS